MLRNSIVHQTQGNPPPDNPHGTKQTLWSKLSGVDDPDEISRIIWEHAEDMSRPPLRSTGDDPMPGSNKPTPKVPKGNLVFVTHGIKKIKKRVCNFGCTICDDVYHTQKDLNDDIRQDHPDYKFKCQHCTRVFLWPMQHTNMGLVMQGKNFPARFVIRHFSSKVH